MKRIKSMKGIEVYRTSDGRERVGVVYYANKGALREMVGDVTSDPAACNAVELIRFRKRLKGKYRDCPTCIQAVRRLDERRAAVKAAKDTRVSYLTPKERVEADAQAADAAEENRAPLAFETCAEKFLAECADDYAKPEEKRLHFRMLGRYFAGRMLDSIRKSDVLGYFEARTANAPPFDDLRRVVKTSTGYMVTLSNGHPQSGRNLTREAAEARAKRTLSPRAPETEIASLSAMFNYLLDPAEDGTGAFPALVRELAPNLSNPCIGWRPRRRRRTKAAKLAYTAKHRAIVPTPEELGAILAGAANARQRALWGVAYYTFSRPESETCQLRLGDVVYSDDPRLRFENRGQSSAMGKVVFRNTKTGEAERAVPLHPVAEGLLKALNLPPRPGRAGESEADYRERLASWEALPIFGRTKGPRKGEPWSRGSYGRGWRATMARAQRILWAVNPEHRDIRSMWLRDTRKGGITAARSQGQDPAVLAKLAGHSTLMSDHYTQTTEGNAAAAIACLPMPVSPTARIPERIPESSS
jgi:hypothetical protein